MGTKSHPQPKSDFLQWNDDRYINHTLGEAPCSGVVVNTKQTPSFCLFIRKRVHELGRLGCGGGLGKIEGGERIRSKYIL